MLDFKILPLSETSGFSLLDDVINEISVVYFFVLLQLNRVPLCRPSIAVPQVLISLIPNTQA